jgi:hypothetical protein
MGVCPLYLVVNTDILEVHAAYISGLNPEDGGRMFLLYISIHLQAYKMSQTIDLRYGITATVSTQQH